MEEIIEEIRLFKEKNGYSPTEISVGKEMWKEYPQLEDIDKIESIPVVKNKNERIVRFTLI